MQQVHLRINDAANGKPTPVRLRITDADGRYYAPHGRLTEFATGPNQDVGGNVLIGLKPWAYIDGACEILLPPGELHIEIAKGPEYKPINEKIALLAGKMSMRFTIERWSDLRAQGWHSSDTRTHFLSTEAAALEAAAEDVDLVHLLAKKITLRDAFGKAVHAIPNIVAFTGQNLCHANDRHAVAVGTLNEHPVLGSLALLHCHRVVFPLNFGGPLGREDWTLFDWCEQCHRKKGLVVWTNPLHQTEALTYGEPLADLILGEIDAFEVTFFENSPFDAMADYYQLASAGLIVPLVGASGKDSNGIALGMMRTYAHLDDSVPFSFAAWIEAVRAGRTYVSNGPLLDVTINGQRRGSHIELQTNDGPLIVHAKAKSNVPFDRLELMWNGDVIAKINASSEWPHGATLEFKLPAAQSGWLAIRCVGETLLPSRPAPQRVFAHTSAIAVRREGSCDWADAHTVQTLLADLEALLIWAREKARCDTAAERERLCHVFDDARIALAKKISQA